MAQQLGVNVNTVTNWEVGRSTPVLRYLPGIVRFLGYVPVSTDGTLPERLIAYRRIHGLSQKRLAQKLGVDPSTVLHWGQGRSRPNNEHAAKIETLLAALPFTEPRSANPSLQGRPDQAAHLSKKPGPVHLGIDRVDTTGRIPHEGMKVS